MYSIMARECGCLGGNENCLRCFGSGYVPDAPANAPVNQGRRRKQPKPAAPVTTPVAQSLFKVKSKIDSDYREHIAASVIPGRRPLVSCPICRQSVRASRLPKHLRWHTQVGNPKPTRARGPVVSAGRNLAKPEVRIVRAGAVGTGKATVTGQDAEERRLDGSRDNWRIRESGRFGSHPTFDSLDDESKP
jgi:hypothetical protein